MSLIRIISRKDKAKGCHLNNAKFVLIKITRKVAINARRRVLNANYFSSSYLQIFICRESIRETSKVFANIEPKECALTNISSPMTLVLSQIFVIIRGTTPILVFQKLFQ